MSLCAKFREKAAAAVNTYKKMNLFPFTFSCPCSISAIFPHNTTPIQSIEKESFCRAHYSKIENTFEAVSICNPNKIL